jgi:uncharacterized protein
VTGPPSPEPGAAAATVTVTGTGTATAVPDTALLELGVEARGSTPAEALDACARALDRVRAALDAAGVDPARRASSGLRLQEDWESRQPGRGPVAYQAGARLTVRLDRPERAGQVAAAAVAAGGDGARVHGLELVVGDPGRVAAAARAAAWRDALARAGQYAELAGMTLGPVLEVREAPPPPDVRPMRLLAAEAAPAGPATDPGETGVWAGVTVTWALRPGPTG